MLGEVFIFSTIIWQLCEVYYHSTLRGGMPQRSMERYAISCPQSRSTKYLPVEQSDTGRVGADMPAPMLSSEAIAQ
jgi:hypothetical protein